MKVRNPWGNGKKVGNGEKLEWNNINISQNRKYCSDSEAWIDFDNFSNIFDHVVINKLN